MLKMTFTIQGERTFVGAAESSTCDYEKMNEIKKLILESLMEGRPDVFWYGMQKSFPKKTNPKYINLFNVLSIGVAAKAERLTWIILCEGWP